MTRTTAQLEAIERLNRAVCRNCGSDELASVERRTYWQPVDIVPHRPAPGDEYRERWATGDNWGDEGDGDSVTVGVACLSCSQSVESDDPAGWRYDELVTTAAAFARLRPRLFAVTLVHYVPSDEVDERGRVRYVRATIRRRYVVEAVTPYLAGEAARRAYAKRHPYPAPSAYPGDIVEAAA